MAPRAYWKGSLKLSLVSCPVALYPATTSVEKTHFRVQCFASPRNDEVWIASSLCSSQ